MGKSTKPRGAAPPPLPFADALEAGDAEALGALLLAALRARNPAVTAVADVRIAQQRGEAFTGGRSTPVYDVAATLTVRGTTKHRAFVAKVVRHGGGSERDAFRRASYANERAFYAAPDALRGRVATPTAIAAEGDDERTCLVLTDLREGSAAFPDHPELLRGGALAAAVRALARFHAAFYAKSPAAVEARSKLFPRGTFWRLDAPGARPFAPTAWPAALRWLEARDGGAGGPLRLLAARLGRAAPAIDAALRAAAPAHGTVVHGDWKAANLFFSDASVACVDFQYAGGGLGAQDLAYVLFPDARGDFLGDGEEGAVEAYFDAFTEALAASAGGSYASYKRPLFRRHYELARLDFFRYMLGSGWAPATDADDRAVRAAEAALGAIDGIVENDAGLSVHVVDRQDYGALVRDFVASG